MIRLIAVGKKHESWVNEGIVRYEKRLKRPFDTEWVFVPHSARSGLEARAEESKALLSRLKETDFVVLLDERGVLFTSPALGEAIAKPLEQARRLIFIIGGAYGVEDTVRERADVVWSLSPLVFPHQLVRLIVIEQIYRVQEIISGHPYHHE